MLVCVAVLSGTQFAPAIVAVFRIGSMRSARGGIETSWRSTSITISNPESVKLSADTQQIWALHRRGSAASPETHQIQCTVECRPDCNTQTLTIRNVFFHPIAAQRSVGSVTMGAKDRTSQQQNKSKENEKKSGNKNKESTKSSHKSWLFWLNFLYLYETQLQAAALAASNARDWITACETWQWWRHACRRAPTNHTDCGGSRYSHLTRIPYTVSASSSSVLSLASPCTVY